MAKKGLLLLSFLFFTFITFSCSNNNLVQEIEEDTLKHSAEKIERKIKWSTEIDANVLEEPIPSIQGLDKKLSTSVFSYNMSISKNQAVPLYPQLESFTSLDLSTYTEKSLSFINSFAKDLIAEKSLLSYMEEDKLYELKIFKYNIEKMTQGRTFPKNMKTFSAYILGSAFLNENVFECPIRLFYSDTYLEGQYSSDHIDLLVYIEAKEKSFKIKQITFMKEEKTDSPKENENQ